MLYLQRIPAAPLAPFIRMLWYARVEHAEHERERILPTGCVQVILNLARDYVLDCPEGRADVRMPPALVVGARSIYEIVDTSDMVCRGVTPISCPIEMAPMETFDQRLTGFAIPRVSAGNSIPVCCPNP